MTDRAQGLIVENIRVPYYAEDGEVFGEAEKRLSAFGFISRPSRLEIYKRSVDARHKDRICFVCSVYAEARFAKGADFADFEKLRTAGIKKCVDMTPSFVTGGEKIGAQPVVIGFGPAGMFASLLLAKHGFCPIVLERGASVDERVAAYRRFEDTCELSEETNIQFGAGGAGTFSDGKLTTRINDPYVRYVLETLCDMGAPDDILMRAKPHIGTDLLRGIVKNFHREIERLGGKVMYLSRVSAVREGYVVVNGERIPSGATVASFGHSARDVYDYIIREGFAVESKPFSVGVRIEHLQRDIDRAMYGDEELCERLGHAEYSLSQRKGERGVYTFCMCPGGKVVAAASEYGGVVTNGMSERKRDGKNANAAVAVSVLPSDCSSDVRRAIEFQRQLERAAYSAGKMSYRAPCQSVGDFMLGRKGKIPTRIEPSYMNGKVESADLNTLFPGFVTSMLKEGIRSFGRKIKGFDADDAPLTGVETRTSAPLRMLRDPETLEAVGRRGIYPCGEGAGYAGGIVSAAVDGVRVAGKIIERFSPPE